MSASPSTEFDNRVSVVIPTHDRRDVVCEAITSVLKQTRPVHELIVVDDGSTDGTSERLQREFPQIRLITQDNHGVSHARNRAIEQATGAWIALLDSDDQWYPDKLAHQIDALEEHRRYRLCHCDEHWIRNGRRVNPRLRHQKHGGDIFAHCLPLCCISPSAAVIHRSVFADVGLFDESLPACEDYDLWLRICAREPVLLVDRALLSKTGGHADQLSRRFPAMDRFRLQALAGIIRSGNLSSDQSRQALNVFREKAAIFMNGARKRGKHDELEALRLRYSDLLETTANPDA